MSKLSELRQRYKESEKERKKKNKFIKRPRKRSNF